MVIRSRRVQRGVVARLTHLTRDIEGDIQVIGPTAAVAVVMAQPPLLYTVRVQRERLLPVQRLQLSSGFAGLYLVVVYGPHHVWGVVGRWVHEPVLVRAQLHVQVLRAIVLHLPQVRAAHIRDRVQQVCDKRGLRVVACERSHMRLQLVHFRGQPQERVRVVLLQVQDHRVLVVDLAEHIVEIRLQHGEPAGDIVQLCKHHRGRRSYIGYTTSGRGNGSRSGSGSGGSIGSGSATATITITITITSASSS